MRNVLQLNHLNVVDRSLSPKLDLNLKREESQWTENLTEDGFKVASGNPFFEIPFAGLPPTFEAGFRC